MSFSAVVQLSALDGRDGFRFDGIGSYDNLGYSVAGAGDVNADGIDDLIIGARNGHVPTRYLAGQTYVVFGHTGSFDAIPQLSALDGSNGFRSVGDVNGDGIGDVIIGAPGSGPNGGPASYVVFGRTDDGSASNHAPVLTGPIAVSTNEDDPAPLTIDLLQGASDPDLEALSVTGFAQTGGPAVPSASLTGSTLALDPADCDYLNDGENAEITFT